MAERLVVPSFRSEAEEAEWYQAHKREVEGDFLRAWKEGRTFRKSPKNPALRPITIRLPVDDIQRAQKQASERGVGYQTYIRMILRDALRGKARRR
jgi:predicted DNA binding CopG/RHH family protein